MEFAQFEDKVRDSLRSNRTFTFFCECKVEYSGRAESYLPRGDRAILVKADNTVLIHQPEGNKPINYMKEETDIKVLDGEDCMVLKTYNADHKDYLDIFIFEIYDFMSKKLYDGKELVLSGDEEDMSDMIKENPEMIYESFKPLSREEHTKYGFIDVFGHDGNGNLVVVECKRYSAGLSAIQQLRRYVEKLKDTKGVSDDKIRGVMAAPDITDNALDMLKDWGFEHVNINPPKRLDKYKKNQKSILDF